jgi:anion-transporting  ArsA/GET3 family ATPase
LADAIGLTEELGNEPQQVPLDFTGELWVTMLDVRETFDGLVRDTSPTPERAREVMENSFYRSLSRSLSGTRDYMAAERLHGLYNDARFDLVIVDTPPSRNALDFLESPERLARFLKHPVVKFLVAPSRGGFRLAQAAMQPLIKALSGVVGSDAITGAAAFLRAFDGMENEFSRRALAVAATLRSDVTHFVVVTAPSPDALKEADHFVSELSRLGITLRLIVANRMPPRFGSATSTSETERAESGGDGLASVHLLIAGLCDDAETATEGVQSFIKRSELIFPQVAMASATEFASDIHDMASISQLARQLAASPTQQ